jgi:hypothetical protein
MTLNSNPHSAYHNRYIAPHRHTLQPDLATSEIANLRSFALLPPSTQEMKLLTTILMLLALACAIEAKKPKPHVEWDPCKSDHKCQTPGEQICFGTSFSSLNFTTYSILICYIGKLQLTCYRIGMCWQKTRECSRCK